MTKNICRKFLIILIYSPIFIIIVTVVIVTVFISVVVVVVVVVALISAGHAHLVVASVLQLLIL